MVDKHATVQFLPCEVWVGFDALEGVCADCGWLEEDHWLAEREVATV